MAVSDSDIEYIISQLSEFGEVRSRKMFGGVGFYHLDVMFAMLTKKGVFRLRADEQNQGDFEAAGMDLMRHPRGTMPYWEVPEEVLSDPAALAVWAKNAFEAALRGKK